MSGAHAAGTGRRPPPADDRATLLRRLEAARAESGGVLVLVCLRVGAVVPGDVEGDVHAPAARLAATLAARTGRVALPLSPTELALALSGGGRTEARAVTEDVRVAAQASGLAWGVSLGVALDRDGPDALGWWAAADAAAQEADRRGGGAAVHADELTGPVAVTHRAIEQVHALCRAAVLEDGPGHDLPAHALLFLNTTPAGLGHPSLDPTRLSETIHRAGLTPEQVVFELTEPTTLAPAVVARGAETLRRAGCKVSLDDLGMGRGSLEWLGVVDADFLKVDSALLRETGVSDVARGLLHAICVVAHHAGARVIVKGVEDAELLALARRLPGPPTERLRLDAAQGYHLGRPAAGPPGRSAAEVDAAAGA